MAQERASLAKVSYSKLLIALIAGAVVWFIPSPEAVSVQGWQLFAIFIGTIVGCVINALPIGAMSLVGLTVVMVFKVLPMGTALSGFTNSTVWLIVMAFFLSRGFIKTGLGNRIAYILVQRFGKKTLGLMYALIGVDLIIAPATPSNTARGGGILFPIVRSLSETFGSFPEEGSRRKIGSFLMFTMWHGNLITSTIFLTAAAPNPLAQELATAFGVEFSWLGYFLAASVPGLIALVVIPFVIFKLYPPEIKETPNAPEWAQGELDKIGPMTMAEKVMAIVFISALVLWVLGSVIGLSATITAFIAVSLLLITGVLTWADIKADGGAWDTLVWFAVLVMMATQLNELGLIPWLSEIIGGLVGGFPWQVTIVILYIAYHYLHYLFASSTAHVSALFPAFLGIAIAAGVPPLFATLMLIFSTNTMVSTTHYANGPAPVFFGAGYVKQNEWWANNAILAIIYFVIFIGIGGVWLNLIGMV